MATFTGRAANRATDFSRGSGVLRRAALLASLSLMVCAPYCEAARNINRLVDRTTAANNGLVRSWFSQVALDPQRSRVSKWLLYDGHIFAVTSSGLVTAIDAETGQTLWTRHVGVSGFAAFGPGANQDFLGVVGGSKLYIYGRDDGRLVWSRQLGSAPSSGPALTDDRAFVALISGRIEGYLLDDPLRQPWYYSSKGRTFLRPTTTGEVVSWPTSTGNLYVCDAEGPEISFRLETNDDIVTSPAEKHPYLYIASMDGYLYCMNELTGREKWRFSTGYAIISSPAIVGDQAYVASQQPALHAINADTGRERWHVRGASHFAAQGEKHTYASDRSGNLLVIDRENGALAGKVRVAEGTFTLVNDQTDRIYLATDEGLIQCLHEIGVTEPIAYRRSAQEEGPDDSTDDESIVSDNDAVAVESEPVADAQEPPPDTEQEVEATQPAVESNPFGDPIGVEGDASPFGPFGE